MTGGVRNQLTYALRYLREPDDATARQVAQCMLDRRIFSAPLPAYESALQEAMRPGDPTDSSTRDLWAAVLDHVRAGGPQRPPRLERQAPVRWRWRQEPAVATVRASMRELSGRLWQVFDFAPAGPSAPGRPRSPSGPGTPGARVPVLIGRLPTGEVLALIVPGGSATDRRETVLKVLAGDPAAAQASFLEVTGLPASALGPPPAASGADSTQDDPAEYFRVFVAQGKLWCAETGTAFDTQAGASLGPGPARALFVLDSQANLYASLVETIGEFHHTSLLSGRPVAAAGEIAVRDGTVLAISGRCPTYPVGAAELHVALGALTAAGLPLAGVTVIE